MGSYKRQKVSDASILSHTEVSKLPNPEMGSNAIIPSVSCENELTPTEFKLKSSDNLSTIDGNVNS